MSDVVYKKEEKCECCGKELGTVEKELFEIYMPTGVNKTTAMNLCLDCMMQTRSNLTRKAEILLEAERDEINEIKRNFSALRVAWSNCYETTFSLDTVDIKKYILGDDQKNIDYPFPKEMGEMGVANWCLLIEARCNQRLYELKEIEKKLHSAD